MKLIVGLGNPGRKYQGTRHNIGFVVVSEVARRAGAGSPRTSLQAELAEATIGGQKTLLAWPQTYMNASGQSVRGICDFYKIVPADLLVVSDDMDLELGRLRFRASGSAGGQRGLKDVLRHLGTEQVPRLRIGIDRPPKQWDPADYVLSKFTAQDRAAIDDAVIRAADAVEDWVREGTAFCMNKYNAKPTQP